MTRATQLLRALMDDSIPLYLRAEIQEWFNSDMSMDEKFDALKDYFMELQPNLHPDMREYELLQKVCIVLGFDQEIEQTVLPNREEARVEARRRIPVRQFAMRIAAVVVVALMVGGGVLLLRQGWGSGADVLVAQVMVETPKDESTRRIVLPDGSQVWLKAESKIEYGDDFVENRSLTLEGEAFFSVTKDEKHPFRVKAGETTVEVLGTEFSVRSFSGDSRTEVTLTKGSVRVEPPKGDVIELAPNERLTFDAVTQDIIVEIVEDFEVEESWNTVSLELVDVPLEEALSRIAAYYGLEITQSGMSGSDDYVNLYLGRDMSPAEVLDVLYGIAGGFSYEITTDGGLNVIYN